MTNDFAAPYDAGFDDSAYSAVAVLLWREREVLDRLLFALTAQQLFLRDGQVRFLPTADEQVTRAVAALQELGLLRSLEVADLAERLHVPAETSLRELAALAPEPWSTLLLEHREALIERMIEIQSVTAENRRLLQAGADAAHETLVRVGDASTSYGATLGRTPAGQIDSIVLDRLA